MLTIFFRGIILYAVSVFAVRLMGKRQIGQLQPYELVAAILIADVAAGPISGADIPLMYGVVPIFALVMMHSLMGVIGMKSPGFRRFINGSARVLVQDGAIQYEELKRVCLTVSDLLEIVRANGIMNLSEAGTVVLETNGAISVFPLSPQRPLTPENLGLSVPPATLPHILITDGQYRQDEIARAGLTRPQLDAFLQRQGVSPQDRVLLCLLDGNGQAFLQVCGEDAAKRVPFEGSAAPESSNQGG